VRNPSHITEPKVTVFEGDILDEMSVIATAQGAEVAISAYGPGPASSAILVRAMTTLVSGLRQAGVRRFLRRNPAIFASASPSPTDPKCDTFPALM
jgi:putative NADH-flavin reductase